MVGCEGGSWGRVAGRGGTKSFQSLLENFIRKEKTPPRVFIFLITGRFN